MDGDAGWGPPIRKKSQTFQHRALVDLEVVRNPKMDQRDVSKTKATCSRPARNTRSMGRCSALGAGLRAWRGERMLGVEAGELGSAGSSGSG